MEIKAELKKPYTNKQRCDFIVENNHKCGYEVQETDEALLAIYNEPLPLTKEEVAKLREQAYIKEVDILHAEKLRKQVLATWTEEDEAEYVAQVKARSEDIANRYPYPVGG